MPKAYFIGGAPRVGKTTLSLRVVEKHPMLGSSSDALRQVLRKVVSENDAPGLFIMETKNQTNDEIIDGALKNMDKAIANQCDECSEVWKSVITFVRSNLEDGFDVLIEGLAILPEFVSNVDFDYSAVFIGNVSDQHIKTTLESAASNSYDWLAKQDDKVAEAYCIFNQNFSRYIESECKKYNQTYIEIVDDDFEKSMYKAQSKLLND
jgi:2-phosphoglycerate kinase